MAGLIVHEWVSRHGGSENVAEAMARIFPDAEILCLWNDDPERFHNRRVRESWLARTPLRHRKALALPFMPAVWSSIDVTGKDFVLVSSHLFAHHVGGAPKQEGPARYVYVHTPARYIWAPELDSRGLSPAVQAVAPWFRRLDARRAASGSVFAANSKFVRRRIRECWDVDAQVIYPPVDIEGIRAVSDWSSRLDPIDQSILARLPEGFVLGASRFVPYKRLDIVIKAGEAAGLPVVLAGSGPEQAYLESLAAESSVPVSFVSKPSDALLYALYQRASVFVFPPVEDFGIMPVEAMSLGTPVLVYAEGGARESAEALAGGAVVHDFSGAALSEGVSGALALDMTDVPQRAEAHFGQAAFEARITEWMADVLDPAMNGA